jgi:hypothetical protein
VSHADDDGCFDRRSVEAALVFGVGGVAVNSNSATPVAIDARGSSVPPPMPACLGEQIHRENLLHSPSDRLAQGEFSRLHQTTRHYLFRPDMSEDDRHCHQPCLPTVGVEVMGNLFTVIVLLLMLPHKAGRQRATAPLTAVRLRVHAGQHALKVDGRHVVAMPKAAGRQRAAVGKVVAGTRTPTRDGVK